MQERPHQHHEEHEPHPHEDAVSMERRAFLKLVGFSLGAVGIAGCSRGPVQTAFTLLNTDPTVVAGKSYWIATSSWADGSGSGILARCVDGRPIKLEGNPGHPISKGGLTATCQASLLSLYDDHRLDGPTIAGRKASWAEFDKQVLARLESIRSSSGKVRILTSTINSPSTLYWIEKFLSSFPGSKHVMYDALSCSTQLDAWEAVRGIRVLPRYDLSKAKIVTGFDADFLGTWISPAGFTADWAAARKPDAETSFMSRHWQFESRLSLTGARADRRVILAPWEISIALAHLGAALAKRAGQTAPGPIPDSSMLPSSAQTAISELANELWSHRGESLLLCGRNDRDSQILSAWINEMIGATDNTLDLQAASLQRRGHDAQLLALREELAAGQIDLLLVAGCNPAFDLPGFVPALKSAKSLISFAAMADETSSLASMNGPEPHELERWDDAQPWIGTFITTQPTVPPLRSARTLRESLARWLGENQSDRTLLTDYWKSQLAPKRESAAEGFDLWFAKVLERGWVQLPSAEKRELASFRIEPVAQALQRIAKSGSSARNGKVTLVLYPKVGILDGRGAHNPWLQELPDPISKMVWDNHADLSPALAKRLGLKTGDIVKLTAEGGATIELPALVQPGQDERTIAVALGYGRLGTDRFTKIGPQWLESKPTVAAGATVGVNAAPLLTLADGQLGYDTQTVSVQATGTNRALACTQDHHSLSVPEHLAPKGGEVREDIVRVIAFPDYVKNPQTALGKKHGPSVQLWPNDHKSDGPRWGMAVDLASCTGCSACVVSCQAENNVPVVGRDEVERHREMSWLRIDRYYAEHPDGSVDVGLQPMMCQHCANAPCETVCPVLATVHSSEGLNQQVYNRCVGTRYCANNCPYKVRRFNWFEYAHEDKLQNMSLNPAVTIRSKGIMEKCSLCVQRIQEAKAESKRRGEPLRDGDIKTACQQSCPSQAIVFGDLNDPASEVSKRLKQQRSYEVLGELNVQSSVHYLADVRNQVRTGEKRHG